MFVRNTFGGRRRETILFFCPHTQEATTQNSWRTLFTGELIELKFTRVKVNPRNYEFNAETNLSSISRANYSSGTLRNIRETRKRCRN